MRITLTDPKGGVMLDQEVGPNVVAKVLTTAGVDLDDPEWESKAMSAAREQGLNDDEATAAVKIERILSPLDPKDRQKLLKEATKQLAANRAEEATAKREFEALEVRRDALDKCIQWLGSEPRMQRPVGSAWHKLSEAFRAGRVAYHQQALNGASGFFDASPHVFVVEHDWASAFRGAEDFADGNYKLPFDLCCFEFQISGARLCAVIRQDGESQQRLLAFNADPIWVLIDDAGNRGAVSGLVDANIRAVCVALEAEVAEADVVRAPEKLNKARARKGRTLLSDYHVVALTRRVRAVPLESTETSDHRRRVRLHFRRGHWRHYEDHKTWIKWMLVGNPDLGFIDKHYRL
jgi:hypothetical protein